MALRFLDQYETVEQIRAVMEGVINGDMILGVTHYKLTLYYK